MWGLPFCTLKEILPRPRHSDMVRTKGYKFKKCPRCERNFRAPSKATNYCIRCSKTGAGNYKQTPAKRSERFKSFMNSVKELRREENELAEKKRK